MLLDDVGVDTQEQPAIRKEAEQVKVLVQRPEITEEEFYRVLSSMARRKAMR